MGEKALPKLSDANLEIMQIVWKHGEVSVLDVMQELNIQRPNKLDIPGLISP